MRKILEKVKSCQNGMSVSSFARFLGMNQQTVYYYLNGDRKMSLDFVYTICEKCGVSADWLLGLSDERSPVRGSVANKPTDQNPNDLIAENAALRGEVKGLRYALEMAIKGAKSVQCSASRGLTA